MRAARRMGLFAQTGRLYLPRQLGASDGKPIDCYPDGALPLANAVVTVTDGQIEAGLTGIGSAGGYWACCFCQTPIDLTGRSRLTATVKRDGHSGAVLNLYLTDTAGAAFTAQRFSSIPYPTADWTEVSWDVSALSGNHYIALGMKATAAAPNIYGYIQKIRVS